MGRNGLIMASMVEFSFVQPLRQGLKISFQILVTASSIVTVSSGQQAFESLPSISNVFPPCQAWTGRSNGEEVS